jgi:hypothetical protein
LSAPRRRFVNLHVDSDDDAHNQQAEHRGDGLPDELGPRLPFSPVRLAKR